MKRKRTFAEVLMAIASLPLCQCGNLQDSDLPFCGECGNANPHFSKYVFERQDGRTLEEALADCRNRHKKFRESSLEDPELFQEYPYCELCGELVIQSTEHNKEISHE